MSSLQTWLLPSAPFSWSSTSFQLPSLHVSSDLRTGKHFKASVNCHQIEKDMVSRAQNVADHAVQLCSRKSLVQRWHLLSIHHPEHRVCKSSMPHPACRVPTLVFRFLQHLYEFILALKTLQRLNFCLYFVLLLHYATDLSLLLQQGRRARQNSLWATFPPLSQYFHSKSPCVFQSFPRYSKPSWD